MGMSAKSPRGSEDELVEVLERRVKMKSCTLGQIVLLQQGFVQHSHRLCVSKIENSTTESELDTPSGGDTKLVAGPNNAIFRIVSSDSNSLVIR
jgi:hypothetical protein